MLPQAAAGRRSKRDPESARQGSNADAGDCRTKLENAHRIVFRVLLYPWHPWFGMQVAIHEVVDKADGAVYRCTLSGSRSDRGLEVPAWMFDRLCCPDRVHLTEAPFVSAGALEALSAVLGMASKASLSSSNPLFSGACNARWCANGLRSEPSSWFLQSPLPNRDWHTQTRHSIERIASDLCFGALIEQTPSTKSSANDGLVAIDRCLNQAPSIVTRSTLPAHPTMLRNHRNMPVALTRRCLVRNCCDTRRNNNRSPWMAFGHSIVDCLTIVRTIGR